MYDKRFSDDSGICMEVITVIEIGIS